MAGLVLTACATVQRPAGTAGLNGTMRPYQVQGVWYRPAFQPDYDEVGLATWYGPESPNHRTADGEPFAVDVASAAHKTLPLPCLVEVTDLETGRRIRVRVNDRGPFVAGRIIDLSPRAARDLGIVGRGSARVRVRYLGPAPGAPPPSLAAAPSSPLADPRQSPRLVAIEVAQPLADAVPAATVPAAPAATFRIRAAAFADRGNADRAVAVLSALGYAHIEIVSFGASTLYRVDVDCPADMAPEAVRQRVIAAGFPGAKAGRGPESPRRSRDCAAVSSAPAVTCWGRASRAARQGPSASATCWCAATRAGGQRLPRRC
jgi:rare lipoprotein A